jgi:hypothetical protein
MVVATLGVCTKMLLMFQARSTHLLHSITEYARGSATNSTQLASRPQLLAVLSYLRLARPSYRVRFGSVHLAWYEEVQDGWTGPLTSRPIMNDDRTIVWSDVIQWFTKNSFFSRSCKP